MVKENYSPDAQKNLNLKKKEAEKTPGLTFALRFFQVISHPKILIVPTSSSVKTFQRIVWSVYIEGARFVNFDI